MLEKYCLYHGILKFHPCTLQFSSISWEIANLHQGNKVITIENIDCVHITNNYTAYQSKS